MSSGQQRTLLTAQSPDVQYGQLAVADGVVYFEQSTSAQQSLFALDTDGGIPREIAPSGHTPVTAQGFLLWTESRSSGTGFDVRTIHRLVLHTLDGSRPDIQVAQIEDQNGFSRYDVTKNSVIWAGSASPISVYDMRTGAITTVGSNTFRPIIQSQRVLWASPTQSGQWSLNSQDLTTGATATIISEDGLSWNFVGVQTDTIAYTRITTQGTENIYLKRLP